MPGSRWLFDVLRTLVWAPLNHRRILESFLLTCGQQITHLRPYCKNCLVNVTFQRWILIMPWLLYACSHRSREASLLWLELLDHYICRKRLIQQSWKPYPGCHFPVKNCIAVCCSFEAVSQACPEIVFDETVVTSLILVLQCQGC